MVTDAEHDELLRQQQEDRHQLMLYATRIGDLEAQIHAYAVHVNAIEDRHRAEMSEVSSRLVFQVTELRAWKAAIERSRTHRLAVTLLSFLRMPVIGPLLRAARRTVVRLAPGVVHTVGIGDDGAEQTQFGR
jgi:hypothetical protein